MVPLDEAGGAGTMASGGEKGLEEAVGRPD